MREGHAPESERAAEREWQPRYVRRFPVAAGAVAVQRDDARHAHEAGEVIKLALQLAEHLEHGHVLRRSTSLLRRMRKALKAAKLDESHRFHDLRHTFGTRMAAAGVPMRTLQEWMGHRDLATTQRYADYAPSTREAEMVAAAFAAPSSPTSEGREIAA